MKKKLLVLAILAALGFYLYSPYRAVGAFRDAINARDSAAITAIVDLPEMRKSVKAQMMANAAKESRLAAAAVFLAEPMIDKLMDQMMTKDGIAKILAIEKAVTGTREATTIESLRWVGVNRVAVKLSGNASTLYFQLGSAGWKLSGSDLEEVSKVRNLFQ
jgi:hypothetical protein